MGRVGRRAPCLEDGARPTQERLYEEHFDFVWRLLVAFGVEHGSLEDAAHDVFVVVARKLPEYDGSSAVTTWLFGIVRRVAANSRRATARQRSRRYAPPEPVPGPDEAFNRHEAARLVEAFVNTLSAPARLLFELREIEQCSAVEIAGLLGVNVNTVYTRCRAIRKRFRRHLRLRAADE